MVFLAGRGWVQEEMTFRLRLCLEEALTNAQRHGNQGNPNLAIRLEIQEGENGCRIYVYDEGSMFDPDKLGPPPTDQAGGRGVCLMKHFMDKVSYDKDLHRLEMTLSRQSKAQGEQTNGH